MSIASVAAQQQTANAGSAQSAAGQNAIGSLSNNFDSFLKLLMTQLQNQDPTSPLDTNQFTSQLVQFSSVEQQINTNTSLTQLIALTQAGEVVQSTAMLGHKVAVQSDQLPLQGGTASLQFTAKTAEPVAIVVTDGGGRQVRAIGMDAVAGKNIWNWDGKDSGGRSLPDGAYRVAVTAAKADGSATAVDFDVVATATGVAAHDKTVQLELGNLNVDFSAVRSVLD